MGKAVIKLKYLPHRLPTTSTIATYLLLDKLQVSGVIWGVFYTVYSLVWIFVIYSMSTTKYLDITLYDNDKK